MSSLHLMQALWNSYFNNLHFLEAISIGLGWVCGRVGERLVLWKASILNLLPELQTAEILHSWKEMSKAVISEIQLTDMTSTSCYVSDFTWSR